MEIIKQNENLTQYTIPFRIEGVEFKIKGYVLVNHSELHISNPEERKTLSEIWKKIVLPKLEKIEIAQINQKSVMDYLTDKPEN